MQHQALPLATRLHVKLLRHLVGLLHLLRVVNVYTSLPSERLRVDVFAVAIVVTEPCVVWTAERQITFQSSLLIFLLAVIDTLGQVVEASLTCQRVVVRERAFRYECPVLLLVLTRIECYHSYSHTVSSLRVFR